mgnify:CR=1 FL=1
MSTPIALMPYPWRCLCLGLCLHVTLRTPCLLCTLHDLQMALTDEETRTAYLSLNTILARAGSYGVSATTTLSPGSILMECNLILPEAYAVTMRSSLSLTLKLALERLSITMPCACSQSCLCAPLSRINIS